MQIHAVRVRLNAVTCYKGFSIVNQCTAFFLEALCTMQFVSWSVYGCWNWLILPWPNQFL